MRKLLVLLVFALLACGGSARPPAPAPLAAPAVVVPLTPDTLDAFLRSRFALAVADGTLEPEYPDARTAAQVIEELAIMGVDTTATLAAVIPADFDARGLPALRQSADPNTNIVGLVRDLLLVHDVERYRTAAWRNAWTATSLDDFAVPRAYGVADVALRPFLSIGDDDVVDDDDDGAPVGD